MKLLTKKEVCDLLRISSRTWDRWRALFRVRGVDVGEVKIGKKACFRPDMIDRLIATPKLWN